MSKFLITGARAPVALEIARNLKHYNHTVIMADSLKFPLSRNSHAVDKFYTLPAPTNGIQQYKNSLLKIIEFEKIEYLIPTCEEVFYISFIKTELKVNCHILCPDFSLIKKLHSKFEILALCQNTGAVLPSTKLVNGSTLLNQKNFYGVIVKREYTRFGNDVLLQPTPRQIRNLIKNTDANFLVQQIIKGSEYCISAISCNGTVYAEAIYEPTHRVKIAAGIYFKPVLNPDISVFIQQFCDKYKYTGMLGFDVIVNEKDIYILECNPRATSGIHLMSQINIADALSAKKPQLFKSKPQTKMISLAMLLIGLPMAITTNKVRQWFNDYRIAHDVISDSNDKNFILFQFLSIAELLLIAFKKKISLRKASTTDIEWDGDNIQ